MFRVVERMLREPGKLILYGNMSVKEQEQLSDLLDNLSGTNTFKVLQQLIGDKFLCFLDCFQSDTINVPSLSKIIKRIEYIKIYNDYKFYSIDYIAKKYHKKTSVVKNIILTVHQELLNQDSDHLCDISEHDDICADQTLNHLNDHKEASSDLE